MKITKLVRDRIPELVEKNKQQAQFHIADKEEYFQHLKQKLQEEVSEFLEDNTVEELVDIIEVLYALAEYKNTSQHQLETLRKKKADERGIFSKRLIIEYDK